MTAEHPDPGLDVGAQHTHTPQRGQGRQQHSQGEGLPGPPGRHVNRAAALWNENKRQKVHFYSEEKREFHNVRGNSCGFISLK